jgi:uncharacterized SAM-binding protein YcdF (DUF218 family)
VFLTLSKLLDLAFAPLTWALLLLLLAIVARRRARALVVLAAALLVVFSVARVSDALSRTAEHGAVRTARAGVVYDAVILLTGILEPAATRATGELQLNDHSERLLATFDLLRSGRARNALISGGLIEAHPGEVTEAERLARQLEAWGIARDRLVTEDRSRNTRENAVESARIVRERGWKTLLLVTSAAHMPRALGCFRHEGLAPDALPVDYRGGDGQGQSVLPRAEALGESTEALRELAGRAVYWVMGYSAAP